MAKANRKTKEKPAKHIKGEEKHVSLLTWILLAILNLAALTVLVAVNGFVVKNVEIENNELYEDSVISDAILNDDYSWNVLYVYAKYQFTQPEEIPFVESLDVSIKDRNTLVIHVNEKAMLGYLYLEDQKQNAYFDVDGYVAEVSDRVIENVPEVEGLSCSEVILYEQLPIDDSKRKNLLQVTQALKRNELIPETITYGVDSEPELTFGNIEVLVGSATGVSQKIERLAAILPSLQGKKGTLHLENWTEQTPDIIFDDAQAMLIQETAESLEGPAEDTGTQEDAGSQ